MHTNEQNNYPPTPDPEARLGQRLRTLRLAQGLSLKALAERSGLNVNTLSLVELGKSSPSVSTLHQLAGALGIALADLFQESETQDNFVFNKAIPVSQNLQGVHMEHLGAKFSSPLVQPYLVRMAPGVESGGNLITHNGYEFVYGLQGAVEYCIDDQAFMLEEGDSLLFQSHKPHAWKNPGTTECRMIMVLFSLGAAAENLADEHLRTLGHKGVS